MQWPFVLLKAPGILFDFHVREVGVAYTVCCKGSIYSSQLSTKKWDYVFLSLLDLRQTALTLKVVEGVRSLKPFYSHSTVSYQKIYLFLTYLPSSFIVGATWNLILKYSCHLKDVSGITAFGAFLFSYHSTDISKLNTFHRQQRSIMNNFIDIGELCYQHWQY